MAGGLGGTIMQRIAAWALAVLLAGSSAWAQSPPTPAQVIAMVNDAFKAVQDKDEATAARLLKQAVQADAFQQLTPEAQYLTQRVLAGVAYDTDDYQTSARAARAACDYPKADEDDWSIRVWAALATQDHLDAVTGMTVLATRWPAKLADFELRVMGETVYGVDDVAGGEELQAKLLQALLAAHWKPADAPASAASGLWLKLLRFDLKWRNAAQAKEVAPLISDPSDIRQMRQEVLFDAIVAADPERFDLDKADARSLAEALKTMNDKPDQLDPVIRAAIRLYTLDRQTEALALLDGALERVNAKGESAFKDRARQLNWLYDTRSRVLLALGRTDEGIAQLESGARLAENGEANVSQIINLADAYLEQGRFADALADLGRMDPKNASPYGRMEYEGARACVYAQLQDAAGLKDSMTFIDAYSGDDVGAKITTLLCTGDIDAAARYVIAELARPERRSAVLAELQEYAQPARATLTPFQRAMLDRYAALRRREDVLKAVAAFGRILRFKTLRYG